MEIEVSIGEIVDKLSILSIKKEMISDQDKLKNIVFEYEYLHKIVFYELKISSRHYRLLYEVNKRLWKIEEDLRSFERKETFDQFFIDLARSVYLTNDRRARIKKLINSFYGSRLVEEKSYTN
jgi:hypothetical protein